MGQITVCRDESQPNAARSDDPSLIVEIGRSMAASLKLGNAVVCTASGTHRRLIEQQLKIRGIDVVGALLREQLVCLNALETLTKIMLDGVPDVIRFAEVIGAPMDRAATRYPRVLIVGELTPLLRSSGNIRGAVKLGELWMSFIESRPVFLQCNAAEIVARRELHFDEVTT